MSEEFVNKSTYMLIDRITGEEVNIDLFIEKASSEYWEKAYAKTLAEYINISGTNTNKVLAYLIKQKTIENIINGTVREIAVKAEASHTTVAKVFKVLQKKKLLKKVRNGCYFLSPDILRHGSANRGAMLIRMWDSI